MYFVKTLFFVTNKGKVIFFHVMNKKILPKIRLFRR